MTEADTRQLFNNKVFTYRKVKEGRVFIYWHEKQVMILKDKQAQRFIDKVSRLNDQESQLVMAKTTGNFKRGNER